MGLVDLIQSKFYENSDLPDLSDLCGSSELLGRAVLWNV